MSDGSSAVENGSSNGGSGPPLSIKHLLIFTAVAAVFFAIDKAANYWSVYSSNSTGLAVVAGRTNTAIHDMFRAATVTGLIALFLHRDSSGRVLRAPGHWVVMAHAIVGTIWLPTRFFMRSPQWMGAVIGVLSLVSAIIYVVIACATKGRWRWMFGARAVVRIIHLPLQFFGLYLLRIVSPLISLAMLVCLVQDTLLGKHRDWVHCLGILTLLVGIATSAFWLLARSAGWFGL